MLKIWGLYVKGLQSYCSTKFKNGLTPYKVEPRPNTLAHTSAVMVERQIIPWELKLRQLVTLRPFDLENLYYLYEEI